MKRLTDFKQPTVSTHVDERLDLLRRRGGMKGRKGVLLIVVSVLLGSWLTLMSGRRRQQRRRLLRARWAGGVDLSMMHEAGALDPADETSREYKRVVDPKYLDQIRTEAKQFSNKLLSHQSGVARCGSHELQKGKEHDQAAYSAIADKGHP